MIVLDASVLIAALGRTDAFTERATALLERYADRPFAASVVTVSEVLVAPSRRGATDAATAALAELGVETLALDADAARALAALRAETGLRLPDCCVLHAARTERADRVLTFDERLANAARHLGFAAGA